MVSRKAPSKTAASSSAADGLYLPGDESHDAGSSAAEMPSKKRASWIRRKMGGGKRNVDDTSGADGDGGDGGDGEEGGGGGGGDGAGGDDAQLDDAQLDDAHLGTGYSAEESAATPTPEDPPRQKRRWPRWSKKGRNQSGSGAPERRSKQSASAATEDGAVTYTVRRKKSEPLGLKLQAQSADSTGVLVSGLVSGSACARSGMTAAKCVGFKVIAVNGATTRFMTQGRVSKVLKATGAKATITLEPRARPIDSATMVVSIECPKDVGLGMKVRSSHPNIPAVDTAISHIAPFSPAYDAGLREGDILVEIDGAPLAELTHEEKLARLSKRRDALELSIFRTAESAAGSGSTTDQSVKNDALLTLKIVREHGEKIGMKIQARTTGGAVTVSHVEAGGAADRANVKLGDRLVELSGASTEGKHYNDVLQMLKAADPAFELMVIRKPTAPQPPERQSSEYLEPTLLTLPRHRDAAATDAELRTVTVSRDQGESLGMRIRTESGLKGSTVSYVKAGGPCDRAGQIKVGDRIVAVDGVSTVGIEHAEVLQLLKDAGLELQLALAGGTGAVRPDGANGVQIVLVKRGAGEKLGLKIKTQRGSDQAIVSFVAPEGPCGMTGQIHAGDQLLEVDGRSTRGLPHKEVMQLLASAPAHLSLGVANSPEVSSPTRADANTALPPAASTGEPLPGSKMVVIQRAKGEKLGMKVRSERGKRGARVSHIRANGPCDRAQAIEKGDIVLEIDGKPTLDMHHEDILAHLKATGLTVAMRFISGAAFDQSSGSPDDLDVAGGEAAAGGPQKPGSMEEGPYAYELTDNVSSGPELKREGTLRRKGKEKAEAHSSATSGMLPQGEQAVVNVREVVIRRQPGEKLGMRIQSAAGETSKQMKVCISFLSPGGACERSQVLRVGNAIVRIDHQPVDSLAHDDIMTLLKQAGQELVLHVGDFAEPEPKGNASEEVVEDSFAIIPDGFSTFPNQVIEDAVALVPNGESTLPEATLAAGGAAVAGDVDAPYMIEPVSGIPGGVMLADSDEGEGAAREASVLGDVNDGVSDALVVSEGPGLRRVQIHRKSKEKLGIKLRFKANERGTRIAEITAGSPCERAGNLNVGDVIVKINDEDVIDLQYRDVATALKRSGRELTLLLATPEALEEMAQDGESPLLGVAKQPSNESARCSSAPAFEPSLIPASPPGSLIDNTATTPQLGSDWRELTCAVSLTTRPKNPEKPEEEGSLFQFLSSGDFHRIKSAGLLRKPNSMGGNWYGSLDTVCLRRPPYQADVQSTSRSSCQTLYPRTSLAIRHAVVELESNQPSGATVKPGGRFPEPFGNIDAAVVDSIATSSPLAQQTDIIIGDVLVIVQGDSVIADNEAVASVLAAGDDAKSIQMLIIRENPEKTTTLLPDPDRELAAVAELASPVDVAQVLAQDVMVAGDNAADGLLPAVYVLDVPNASSVDVAAVLTGDADVLDEILAEDALISGATTGNIDVAAVSSETGGRMLAEDSLHAEDELLAADVVNTTHFEMLPETAMPVGDSADSRHDVSLGLIEQHISCFKTEAVSAEQCVARISQVLENYPSPAKPERCSTEAGTPLQEEIDTLRSGLEKEKSKVAEQQKEITGLLDQLNESQLLLDSSAMSHAESAEALLTSALSDAGGFPSAMSTWGPAVVVNIRPHDGRRLGLPLTSIDGLAGVYVARQGISTSLRQACGSGIALRAGDRIVEVNGRDVRQLEVSGIRAVLSKIKFGSRGFSIGYQRVAPVAAMSPGLLALKRTENSARELGDASLEYDGMFPFPRARTPSSRMSAQCPSSEERAHSPHVPASAVPPVDNSPHSTAELYRDEYVDVGGESSPHTAANTEAEPPVPTSLALGVSTDVDEIVKSMGLDTVVFMCILKRDKGEPLGMQVYADEGVRGIMVAKVEPGQAAERAGLVPQDHILQIDGMDVSRYWYDDAVNVLRKTEQTVKILVSRPLRGISKLRGQRVYVTRVRGEPLGAELHFRGDSLSVTRVHPNHLAQRCGLAAGDRVTHINGVRVDQMPSGRPSKLMRKTTSLSLKVQRPPTGLVPEAPVPESPLKSTGGSLNSSMSSSYSGSPSPLVRRKRSTSDMLRGSSSLQLVGGVDSQGRLRSGSGKGEVILGGGSDAGGRAKTRSLTFG